jgi:hypothetical protein
MSTIFAPFFFAISITLLGVLMITVCLIKVWFFQSQGRADGSARPLRNLCCSAD